MRLVIVLSFLLVGPALAEPIPQMDVDVFCRTQYTDNRKWGDAAAQYDRCFDNQQYLYNELKPKWSKLSEEQQRSCVKAAESYNLFKQLHTCAKEILNKNEAKAHEVEREEARKAVSKREFRY